MARRIHSYRTLFQNSGFINLSFNTLWSHNQLRNHPRPPPPPTLLPLVVRSVRCAQSNVGRFKVGQWPCTGFRGILCHVDRDPHFFCRLIWVQRPSSHSQLTKLLPSLLVFLLSVKQVQCTIKCSSILARMEGTGLVVSDSYPAFFLLIATTSNKNF